MEAGLGRVSVTKESPAPIGSRHRDRSAGLRGVRRSADARFHNRLMLALGGGPSIVHHGQGH